MSGLGGVLNGLVNGLGQQQGQYGQQQGQYGQQQGNMYGQNQNYYSGVSDFRFKAHNELSCLAQGSGEFHARKGTMICYQGDFKFDKVLIDPSNNLVKGVVNHVVRKATGENIELMRVRGQGLCYLAEDAQHIQIIDLEPGEELSVESENILAFNECDYTVHMVGTGVISQRGLFSTRFRGRGVGAQVAIKTDGNPIILKTPCMVDPDAIVAWTGPNPGVKTDIGIKTIIGQTSGESYMLKFDQAGFDVIVQPSERLSGLKLGIDDKRYSPQNIQNQSFQNSQNEIGSALNVLGNLMR